MNIMKRIIAALVVVWITVWLKPDTTPDKATTSVPSGAKLITTVVSGFTRTVSGRRFPSRPWLILRQGRS